MPIFHWAPRNASDTVGVRVLSGLSNLKSSQLPSPSKTRVWSSDHVVVVVAVAVVVSPCGMALASSVSQRLQVVPEAAGHGCHGVVVLQLRRCDVDVAKYSQSDSGETRAA